ncbi:MAG: VWA domain-containing protein [Acetobacteraceae bacterium]|nr:VWA domain-containing protein [Acetobacteraceae bacterium]
MNEVILRLLRAARGNGVRISVAEAIDAFHTVSAIGYDDRQALKDSLSLTLAKTIEEKILFDDCFDLYFKREAMAAKAALQLPMDINLNFDLDGTPAIGQSGAGGGAGGGEGHGGGGGSGKGQGQGSGSALGRMLLANDEVGLAAAMETAAEDVGVSNISLFTQTNMYARRILDRMGLSQLEREIEDLRNSEWADDAALGERLDMLRKDLAERTRAFVERQLALFGAGTRREIREGALRTAQLSSLDRRDFDRMHSLVRDMAKRIASKYGRTRHRDRKGVLDIRRTIKRNMSFDSIPFRTVWKRKKIDKPKVMAICDVSGSVAQVARFLLLFLYTLTDTMRDIRSFAFSGDLIDVSEILEREEIEPAILKILEVVGFRSTNYGKSLEDFDHLAMGDLDRKTTVIILGDARGNRNEARVDLMEKIFNRASRVIWLNPEHRASWGTGDSDMLRYTPFCHTVATCGTVAHLERIVQDLLREAV